MKITDNVNTIRSLILVLLGILLATSLLTACGKDGNGTPGVAARTYLGTQSPGDLWQWTIGDATFSATNLTTTYTYSGTKTTLPSGFLKLVLTATTEPGATLPTTAYALEYPNTVLLVKPAGSGSGRLIAAVAKGACPTATENYNWVDIPHLNWDATVTEAYGTATMSLSGSTYTFDITKHLLAGTLQTPVTETAACADGQFTLSGSSVAAVTPSKAIVVDNGPGEGGVFGMIAPTANVDLTAIASKNYRGVLFKRVGTADTTEPVGAEPGTGLDAGNLKGFCYTDVEANTRCANPVTLDLVGAGQTTAGIVSLTLTDADSSLHTFVFMANQVGGKYLLFGISTNTSSTEPYNVILIEQ
ncbi:MAG: hypothetical protein HY204_03000 [Nitrospirae bacterium]|nr:hypothetical protein [Nitrospirota bacterium]